MFLGVYSLCEQIVNGSGIRVEVSMELREYMSIRRSYNLVRRVVPANRRLTFEEFAILCRLNVKGAPVKTS